MKIKNFQEKAKNNKNLSKIRYYFYDHLNEQ